MHNTKSSHNWLRAWENRYFSHSFNQRLFFYNVNILVAHKIFKKSRIAPPGAEQSFYDQFQSLFWDYCFADKLPPFTITISGQWLGT